MDLFDDKREYYTTIGEVEKVLLEYYEKNKTKWTFVEALLSMFKNGMLLNSPPNSNPNNYGSLLDAKEFEQSILNLSITVKNVIQTDHPTYILEDNVIPLNKDIFAFKHLTNVDDQLHVHNHFEINYVYFGSATQLFENEQRKLTEGDLCIIAPNSKHDVLANSSSLIISIMMRKSSFDKVFWSLLSQKDLLAIFFRNTLYMASPSNYLIFKTDNNDDTKRIIQSIIFESNNDNKYANSCCISWINLLFAYVLRKHSTTIQYYDYKSQHGHEFDFSAVLNYIQHNYPTVTLASLADFFNYSEAYLSKLIKRNLKQNFSTIIKNLKMSHAVDYLTSTQFRISEVSDLVGYDSVDHFSRTFKNTYRISPLEYRKTHTSSID